MSRENVEIVERAFELWNRGDLDAVLSFYDPQVEIDFTRIEGWPESDLLIGVSQFREFLSDWRTTWDCHRPVIDTVLDAGDDRVIALIRETGRGRGSSREVELELAHLYTLHKGLIVRLDIYGDRVEALEAVGLRE